MWRVQGFVGRALHRLHGSHTLRLTPNHHVEDEVLNSSAALSTSRQSSDSRSQKEEDGERNRKERTFQFDYAKLPRYTALDAVGWGAVAVLLMQICRRVHSSFSSSSEASPHAGSLTASSSLQRCGYRILLDILSRRDVLPRGRSVLCLQGVPESPNADQSSTQSSSNSPASSEQQSLTADISDHQGELLFQHSHETGESLQTGECHQNDTSPEKTVRKNETASSEEEKLSQAALNLKHVGDTSIPVILNIIGLENTKTKNYREAFVCFKTAAQQGYSKAQFNTAVCYEKGRGVDKDIEKALHFYRQAAAKGHKQAQYRYAKLLLTSRGHQSAEEMSTVINLLTEAAAAGITKAQLCLASIYSQDPMRNVCKSITYLKMAAESGDDTALLFLGQCYESGFGVPQNFNKAAHFYKQAAQAGNKQAKSLLTPHSDMHTKAEDVVMRSIQSAPCFPVADSRLLPPPSSLTTSSHQAALPLLPHSWSTGNLGASRSLSSRPLHLLPSPTERGRCQWTVGVG
ncbi:death ligand signal enhancer isoform X1 [Oryzias melastigma]|uniref:death ligand signal enhancer isoform X1 n=1 Tax=Oryzias melastigma TaxID=30732 RepID=UPI000CF81BA3|nr:death ligand signal enhancer isoform X1 [Oryzias melastigma]